jgi:hypothetical protein
LHIVGEVRLAVRHCLLANPGVKIENLKSAMSHPQVNRLVDLALILFILFFVDETCEHIILLLLGSCAM